VEAFENYRTKLKYPVSKDFTKYYVYSKGKLLYETELGELVSECYKDKTIEKYVDDDAFKSALNYYSEDSARLLLEFEEDLYKELCIEFNRKRHLLYEKAIKMAESDSLERIFDVAYELVDLIEI